MLSCKNVFSVKNQQKTSFFPSFFLSQRKSNHENSFLSGDLLFHLSLSCFYIYGYLPSDQSPFLQGLLPADPTAVRLQIIPGSQDKEAAYCSTSQGIHSDVYVVLLEWFRMKQTKMYVCTLEEFILVDIWIHWSWISKWRCMENTGLYTLAIKGMRNVRIALDKGLFNRITIAWETVTSEN